VYCIAVPITDVFMNILFSECAYLVESTDIELVGETRNSLCAASISITCRIGRVGQDLAVDRQVINMQ